MTAQLPVLVMDPCEDKSIAIPSRDEGLPSHVVGIGASAGGLEALERLFRAMPIDTGMAFVVIQHLSPDFKSLMDELMERFTRMPAIPVRESQEVRPNTIYLLPPAKDIVIEGNLLITRDRAKDGTLSLPINTFLRSLAVAWGEQSVAIILSGTGSDGSSGLIDIHDAGGLVLVESPASARFDGMPQSAIKTGSVDAVLMPEDMPEALIQFGSDPMALRALMSVDGDDQPPVGMPAILDLLHKGYNIDFSSYKPTTITRRIARRLSLTLSGESVEDYAHRLASNPEELNLLYKDLLIGVTRFFRDGAAFNVLRDKVIPEILDHTPAGQEVRIWDCGCSTGEEAYSLAILFLEAFAAQGRVPLIKVLATDLHEESLQIASEGIYRTEVLGDLPDTILSTYFEPLGEGRYKVMPHLRQALVFSAHNLLKDPPFTKIDLVSCRNLLIYLLPAAQTKAIANFHYALRLNGVLFLGASESLGNLADEFDTIDRHWKLYRKTRESRNLLNLRSTIDQGLRHPIRGLSPAGVLLNRIYDTLLERYIPTGFLINEQREVLHIFGDASRYLQPRRGRFSGDLLSLLTSSDLTLALTSALRNVVKQDAPIELKSVLAKLDNQTHERLKMRIEPVGDRAAGLPCYLVTLEEEKTPELAAESSPVHDFSVGVEVADYIRELELELQRARESVQTTMEELETSNEELQATNEELLAANEELQSTNEELHSVNEELYSVNAEHELKIEELNKTTSDLRNLMQSTDTATIFIDNDYRIRLFTPRATEVFNLLPQDIGRDLRHFQSTQPDLRLFDDIRQVLATEQGMERQLNLEPETTFLRRCMPYQSIMGKQIGVVINYVDTSSITRMHRQIDELRRLSDEASRAHKAMSQFLANMSHELRTPLNALIGMAHLLGEADLTEDQREQVTTIQIASRNLMSIINDVLDLSKIEAGAMPIDSHAFAPAGLLDELRQMFRPLAAAKKLSLVVMPPPEDMPLTLIGDSTRIKQILVNLINNAIKFTHEGRVSLETYLLETQGDSLRLRFVVSDTGEGIAPDVQARLFLPFSQGDASTTRRHGGTGLGLSIVRQLAELMDGRVGLDTRLGQGSSFWVEIPLRISDEPLRDPRDQDSLCPLRLLIASGEAPERRRLRDMALRLGWDAEEVDAGEAMMRKLCGQPGSDQPYDAVLIQGPLPDRGLASLLSEVETQSDTNPRPALLVVAGPEGDDLDLGPASALIDSLITQPLTPSLLLDRVSAAVTRRFPQAQAQGPWLPGVRVLVVDDSQMNLDVCRRLLEREGATPFLCENGAEAVACLRQFPDAYDIVLMDVQMPVMDGYEATRLTRQELGLADLPIIALTAGALVSERDAALKAGMTDFLTKPIDPALLARVLCRHLKRLPGGSPPAPARTPATTAPGMQLAGPAAARDAWPEIPGIDSALAQAQYQGDRGFFLDLISRFAEEGRELVDAVEASLDQDDLKAAAAGLHKLRGLAGNLYAKTLMTASRQLEEALVAADPDWPRLRNSFRHSAHALLGAIAPWRGADQGQVHPRAAGGPIGGLDQLETLLDDLENQLRQKRFDAKRTSLAVEERLADLELAQAYRPVAEAVRRLRFQEALAKLSTFRNQAL